MNKVQFSTGTLMGFSSPPRPDRRRGPTSLPSSGCLGLFPEGRSDTGRKADHSTQSSAEVKNAWIYTSTPQKYLHGVVLN
jgi:hypothetical protein